MTHLHRFRSIEVEPLALEIKKFPFPMDYTVDELSKLASKEVAQYLESRQEWHNELQEGKMFGVLVVRDQKGEIGFLAAFSGAIIGSNDHPYFVPPIFDILDPEGYFIKEEMVITRVNQEIESIELSDSYALLRRELEITKKELESNIIDFQAKRKINKARRDEIRANSCNLSNEMQRELTRESQFEKAELKRIKERGEEAIKKITSELNPMISEVKRLKSRAQSLSKELQRWLFDHYIVNNAKGERSTITEIFERASLGNPPAATGECAAPKLLQYAYLNGLLPITMAEFWYGESTNGTIRHHLSFYPACKSRCEPLLGFMLQGLDVDSGSMLRDSEARDRELIKVVYEDESLLVVDKPEGILSVSGRIRQLSIEQRLVNSGRWGEVYAVHRLDMSTSGLLIFAKSREVLVMMQRIFATREVHKEYEALLEGRPEQMSGFISLPLSADYENRPLQRVDMKGGKVAETRFEVIGNEAEYARVRLYPLTGRTHQLRVHMAYSGEGGVVGVPILGDRLYGVREYKRLCLHASAVEFRHPVSGDRIRLTSSCTF